MTKLGCKTIALPATSTCNQQIIGCQIFIGIDLAFLNLKKKLSSST
uniref:Uncharacterized protein n=1 Tax=Rhizophora mucronata TaxID=61149 RepID=A0A2P2K752_RHIMU